MLTKKNAFAVWLVATVLATAAVVAFARWNRALEAAVALPEAPRRHPSIYGSLTPTQVRAAARRRENGQTGGTR